MARVQAFFLSLFMLIVYFCVVIIEKQIVFYFILILNANFQNPSEFVSHFVVSVSLKSHVVNANSHIIKRNYISTIYLYVLITALNVLKRGMNYKLTLFKYSSFQTGSRMEHL